MEIRAIQEYLDKNLVDADSVYASYSLGSLLQLGQNGDKKAKLQVLVTLKGLMYNSLKLHMAYLWLPEDDTLQMLSETVLHELKGWNAADPEGFCTHISHCFKNIIRNGVRRSCNHKVKEFSLGGTPEVEASPAEKLLDAREWENFFDSDRKATQQFSVRELLGRLTEKQRYVLTAEIFEDRDDVEIARMMNVKKAAVCRTKRRAVKQLRRILKVRQREGLPLC